MVLLVEPEVRHIIQTKLLECHQVRVGYYSKIFNIALLITMVLGIAVFIYIKWKYKPTEEEKQARMKREQEYILSQIKFYQGVMMNR
jgi:hypothetical protein